MSSYQGRTEFTQGRGFVILYAALTLLFATGMVYMRHADGWSWVTLTFAGMTLLSIGAIVETLLLRINLTSDALVVRGMRGRRSYARDQIERIEEAKGSPAAILLKGGRWVRLPSVGSNLGNSVRAWLRVP